MTRKPSPSCTVLSLSALALLITGAVLYAGPLSPPAGPVTSTYKTLTEVEPRIAVNATNTPGDGDSLFKITQPGSYYLTGNITGVVGKHGIEIAASGVTLDLSGFDLVGVPAMGAFDGVSTTVVGLTNIAVVNGSVRAWGDEGVDLTIVDVQNTRVANLFASANGDNGILAGHGATVTNCSAFQNTSTGIGAGFGCVVTDCTAYDNTGSGISVSTGGKVTNCSAYSNTGNGISAGVGCTVTNCTAYQNSNSGISVSAGCAVADCTARANAVDGIVCSSACVIRANACSLNGTGDGAGIHATSTDNRIEGNNCTNADRGIDVDAAGNIIIKNTCSGNTTNWSIAAGNAYGPIVATPAGALVNGNAAVAALGSTDPNANFSY